MKGCVPLHAAKVMIQRFLVPVLVAGVSLTSSFALGAIPRGASNCVLTFAPDALAATVACDSHPTLELALTGSDAFVSSQSRAIEQMNMAGYQLSSCASMWDYTPSGGRLKLFCYFTPLRR